MRTYRRSGLLISKYALEKLYRYLINFVGMTRQKIEEKNLTALMITHNIQDAVKYGNRIIVLHRGELVRDISKEEKEKLDAKALYELLYNLEESE